MAKSTGWRPRDYQTEKVWRRVFTPACAALAEIFPDLKIDQDEWARTMLESKSIGYPWQTGGAMWTTELQIVAAVYRHLRPRVALEVGVYCGASLRAAREYHQAEHHIAYDVDPKCVDYCPKGVLFILRGELGSLQLPEPFDVATLDDGHSQWCCRRWLDTLADASRVGSVVLVHDMRVESVGGDDRESVVDFLSKGPGWEGFELRTPCGLAILRRTT